MHKICLQSVEGKWTFKTHCRQSNNFPITVYPDLTWVNVCSFNRWLICGDRNVTVSSYPSKCQLHTLTFRASLFICMHLQSAIDYLEDVMSNYFFVLSRIQNTAIISSLLNWIHKKQSTVCDTSHFTSVSRRDNIVGYGHGNTYKKSKFCSPFCPGNIQTHKLDFPRK